MSESVSVIVPAYNAEQHLERAVDSALAQTLPPAEILLVDDASTDGTWALMQSLAQQHATVRALQVTVNGGPGPARNLAMDAATGDWLAILDADDAYTPGRLAALTALAEQTGADVVVDNFVFAHAGSGAVRPSRIPGQPRWEAVDRYRFLQAARAFNYAPTWTLLQPVLRRRFVQEHGLRYPTHTRHGEDFLFMVDVLLAGARCVRSGAAGYLYTERSGGASTTRLDYSGLVEQTTRLLQDPRVVADPRTTRLLRRRLSTLRCLQAERTGRAALVTTAVRHPGVAATLSRRTGRRVARLVTRPGPDPLPPML